MERRRGSRHDGLKMCLRGSVEVECQKHGQWLAPAQTIKVGVKLTRRSGAVPLPLHPASNHHGVLRQLMLWLPRSCSHLQRSVSSSAMQSPGSLCLLKHQLDDIDPFQKRRLAALFTPRGACCHRMSQPYSSETPLMHMIHDFPNSMNQMPDRSVQCSCFRSASLVRLYNPCLASNHSTFKWHKTPCPQSPCPARQSLCWRRIL